MGLFGNLLYVTELTDVAVIDIIAKAKIIQQIPVAGSQFLNDITVDAKGAVYVSDSKIDKVYKIENGAASLYLDNIKNANGVLAVGSDLYVLSYGSLIKVDKNKNRTTLVQGLETSTDGIEMVKENEFLVTAWVGVGYYVKADGSKQVLFDTRDKKINSADIAFDAKNKMVYVPHFL